MAQGKPEQERLDSIVRGVALLCSAISTMQNAGTVNQNTGHYLNAGTREIVERARVFESYIKEGR
jgi:hypothetical protein